MRTTAIAIMIIAFGVTGAAQMLSGDGAAVTVYGFEFDRHAANVEDGTRLPQAEQMPDVEKGCKNIAQNGCNCCSGDIPAQTEDHDRVQHDIN